MRIGTILIGAGLLAGGVALGAYHRVASHPAQSNAGTSASATTASDSNPSASLPTASAAHVSAADTVLVEMKNVDFHLTDKIVIHIASLEGKLAAAPGQIPVFDDKRSFSVDASSADVAVSTQALTNDLNDFVFAKPDAPVKKLRVTTQGNELVIKGLLASKRNLPFESDGVPEVTADGMIRVHTVSLKTLRVPVKGLIDKLGLHTSALLNTQKVDGVTVDGDDLILDPQKILPPPHIRGRLAWARVNGNGLELRFRVPGQESANPAFTTTCGGQNFLAFKGGSVRFGKLTMTDTDLELLDSTPAGPFDFSLDHYQRQLEAGFSKTTVTGGLCVHMPDLAKVATKGNGRQQVAGN